MAYPPWLARQIGYLYRLAWGSLDWLYPPVCGGCKVDGVRWCATCKESVRLYPEHVCQRCGQNLTGGELCRRCQVDEPPFQALRAWAIFEGPLRNAIHRLKYQRDLALGEILARNLLDMLQITRWPIDLVVPIPLGKARLAERGYNQAAFLALPVAIGCAAAYRPGALERRRETRSQITLTVTQRDENVRDAFEAAPEVVRAQNILIIDDVLTSGATMRACANALRRAGARQVYGLALARPLHPFDVQGQPMDN